MLDAAAACFREYGFHGSSIQRISQSAGMSPGHIYHYFANKEAIVGGIVEGYVHETLDFIAQIEAAARVSGLVEAMTAKVESGLALRSDPGRIALIQEIHAEASRNPVIATEIQQADRTVRQRMRKMLRELPALKALPARDLDARITVMNTLFDGFSTRVLCDPKLDPVATSRLVRGIMQGLMSA